MKIKLTLISLFFIGIATGFAQFSIDAEFKPRTEYRHGFGTLITDDAEPGFGISTRARLNFGYATESYKVYLSFQDVLVWGENRQILPYDQNNSFAVFQAWASIKLGEPTNLKLGRQILSYDDQRILGALDWAQQGRNHDAALFQYKKDKFMMDLALAFNQDYSHPTGFNSVGNTYSTTGFFSYKTMQMAYFKNNWDNFSGSLLLLNNGFQNFDDGGDQDGISNLQTFGSHMAYKKNKFGATADIYFQFGERQGMLDVKGAYLFNADFGYQVAPKTKLSVGMEMISGDDGGAGETGAFFPLYGTNHKFNGFMDYFYVGNHANSIGLVDIHVQANFSFDNNSGLMLKLLNFSGEQELPSGEKSLGTEFDIVYSKKFNGFNMAIGYSQMFESDGMYELKDIDEGMVAGTQNWFFAQLVFKPKFL